MNTRLTTPHAAAALLALFALVGCSTKSAYNTAQQMQKQECQKLQDREERMRCEKNASMDYERYKAEADKKAKP